MARAVLQSTIQTSNGTVSVAGGASVEVRDTDNNLVTLYSARSGGTTVANPVTADADGFFRVYLDPQRVRIIATSGGSSRTWEDVVLTDDVTPEPVQTEINRRTIYVGSISELEAIPSPVDGQEVLALGTPFIWNDSDSEWKANGPINLKLYGAVGDGVTDDGAAIKAAIEALKDGDTLFFPPGHYYSPYSTHTEITNWARINANGVTLTCEPETVVLENSLILAAGEFDAPINIGSAGFTSGDNIITTSSAHGLQKGDVIQLLSQRNSYTLDGLDYQLGSQNPTNLETPNARFSEIHVVKDVPSSTEIELEGVVVYPEYEDNTTSLSEPISGVTSAQVRKISMVEGLTIENIRFENNNTDNARGVYLHGAKDCKLKNIELSSEGRPVTLLRTENVDGLVMDGVKTSQKVEGSSGSAWNIIKIAGGSQNVKFMNGSVVGGHQPLDFTPATDDTSVVSTLSDTNSEYLTVQFINVENSKFYDSEGAGFTTHPGTYSFSAIGNEVWGGSIALLCRSRSNTISGNKFHVARVGCQFSAFYENTVVVGNTFKKNPSALNTGNWSGIIISPMSSEIMNNNDIKSFLVSSNVFSGDGGASDFAVRFRHVSDGTPPNSSFTKFTDSVKSELSQYSITGNNIDNLRSSVGRFINGVTFAKNECYKGSSLDYFFNSSEDSARNLVYMNMFEGSPTNQVVINGTYTISYSYSTQHKVDANLYRSGLNNLLTDSGVFNTD